jgi:hypothetical protein
MMVSSTGKLLKWLRTITTRQYSQRKHLYMREELYIQNQWSVTRMWIKIKAVFHIISIIITWRKETIKASMVTLTLSIITIRVSELNKLSITGNNNSLLYSKAEIHSYNIHKILIIVTPQLRPVTMLNNNNSLRLLLLHLIREILSLNTSSKVTLRFKHIKTQVKVLQGNFRCPKMVLAILQLESYNQCLRKL